LATCIAQLGSGPIYNESRNYINITRDISFGKYTFMTIRCIPVRHTPAAIHSRIPPHTPNLHSPPAGASASTAYLSVPSQLPTQPARRARPLSSCFVSTSDAILGVSPSPLFPSSTISPDPGDRPFFHAPSAVPSPSLVVLLCLRWSGAHLNRPMVRSRRFDRPSA